jgi:hypothetical protein
MDSEWLRGAFGVEAAAPPEPLAGGRVNRCWRWGPWLVKAYDPARVPPERMLQALRLQVWCAQAGLPVPAPRWC